MEACALDLGDRDPLDEGCRIARGERSVLGLPILPTIDHCIALYQEILRWKELAITKAAVMDDAENLKAVAINLGKETP